MIEKAAKILDVKGDVLTEFSLYDPYNRHTLSGVCCRQSDYRYGALVLFSIDDYKTEQVIYCTPKLEYPFNKNGDFLWPNITQIEVWDKLDGTNIYSYWYEYKGDRYLTFKTRLSPVLKDGPYGGFQSMWDEYCHTNPWISQVILENKDFFNLSFELYGSRNPITVQYDTPLEVALLFGVRHSDHIVRPPSQLKILPNTKLPERIEIDSKSELTDLYLQLQKNLKEKNDTASDDVFITEGVVLYAFCNEPSWRQFKCKHEDILKLHWGNSGIPMRELLNTAVNSFEDGNSSLEYFIELLKEEYTDQQLGKSEQRIQKVFAQAKERAQFISKVNGVWKIASEQGFDITKDKIQTLRFISQCFNKKEMKKVGTIILKQAGLI